MTTTVTPTRKMRTRTVAGTPVTLTKGDTWTYSDGTRGTEWTLDVRVDGGGVATVGAVRPGVTGTGWAWMVIGTREPWGTAATRAEAVAAAVAAYGALEGPGAAQPFGTDPYDVRGLGDGDTHREVIAEGYTRHGVRLAVIRYRTTCKRRRVTLFAFAAGGFVSATGPDAGVLIAELQARLSD